MTTVQATCIASVAAFTALASVPATAAEHVAHLRSVDDQVFGMMVETRALRWTVVDTPISESDRRHLLRHVDEVYEELVDLQRNVFRGRSTEHLCGEADDVHEAVCELRDELRERSRDARDRGRISQEVAMRVEGLHSATEALHVFIEGHGVISEGPVVPWSSPTGVHYPERPIYEIAPPPSAAAPATYPPPRPAGAIGRRPVPSSHYGSPYPRTLDVVHPPAPFAGSDHHSGGHTDVVRPRKTPLPLLPRPTTRHDRAGDGLKTLGWVLSRLD